MIELVVASANPNKSAEIAAILKNAVGDSFTLLSRPPEVPDVEETGVTLEENAILKADALVVATGKPAIADDTGLEVAALGGAPGVYSARYAGEDATYLQNVEKLVVELGSTTDRQARFRTVAVAKFPDGTQILTDGSIDGSIAFEPRGTNGFGYDAVFVPDGGGGLTFAEMTPEQKDSMSHRGRAFRSLAQMLLETCGEQS